MKKIPMILIPGLLCDAALWGHQVASLHSIAECKITEHHRHHATIGLMADAIVAEAPARFALAGLSMGGYIALEICRKYGDRVERLALIDTSARSDTPAQTDRRKSLIKQCREGNFHSVPETLYPFLVHPDRMADATLKRQVIDMAARVGAEVFLRQQRSIMDRIDQVPNLSSITCPTMIVCGEHDQITPRACSEEMVEKICRSELVIVGDCGHMSTMEKPETVSSIMYNWFTKR
ncbi:MAG: alpha/beta hydrolase [Pseudomonadota bacterium]